MSRYQKRKTNLDFTEARDSEWQWYQLGHMQVCTLLQTDNHASTPPLSFFTGRMPFLPPNQQRQSTEGINQTESKKQKLVTLVTHTHTFKGLLSETIRVSRYQKGNHASTPPISFLHAGCPSCCPTNSVKILQYRYSLCIHLL